MEFIKITKYIACAVCFVLMCISLRNLKKVEEEHGGNKSMKKMITFELFFWIMMLLLTIGRVDIFVTFA